MPSWLHFVGVAVGAGVLFTSACVRSIPSSPDVILITIDTLRADHLGSYGDARAATPVLDRLARSGTRFAHVVAPVPLTLPSHASLLTGVTPLAHGVHDNVGFALGPAIPTLAERFKTAGYETGAFVSGAPLDRASGLARGFDTYDDRMTRNVERRADETVAAVGEWLRQDSGAHTRPLFLWVHLFDPHAPYEAPEPFGSRFAERPYDGEIAFVDAQIGVLLDDVKRARPDRRAIVAVTADHGEGLGEHGEPTHGLFVYDSTIRVPLILEGAGVPVRLDVQRMAQLIDVAPTLLDIAGVAALERIDGTSLRPSMNNGAAAAAEPAYVESRFGRMCCGWAPVHAWRDGRWMLIDVPKVELYDLSADPGQLHNVAADQPSTIDVLRAQGLAYVRFALKTPELYRIAMMSESRPGSDVDMALNTSAFVHMRNTVESLIEEGIYPPGDPITKALELWTVAHGVAALLISRPYLPWGDVESFADGVMKSVCVGQIVSGAVDPDLPPSEAIALLKGMLDGD